MTPPAPAPQASAAGPNTTRITLPYPVSVNDLYRMSMRHGRPTLTLTNRGRTYRASVAEAVLLHRSARHKNPELGNARHGTAPLSLRIRMYPPTDGRHDIDNILKATLDSLEAAHVFENDGQIAELLVTRHQPVPGGRLDVVLQDLP